MPITFIYLICFFLLALGGWLWPTYATSAHILMVEALACLLLSGALYLLAPSKGDST
ncbi:hypothetical protein [Formicincola oecophyllae]|uniref:hypothetical protein n=1 Tax=Formicincola oecophyllae TaxID=2558361 RepID=UPI00143D95AD|nr:hypothetical protein [Formicincola oecophyllae]